MSRVNAARLAQDVCKRLADEVAGLTRADVVSLFEADTTAAGGALRRLLQDGIIERAGESRRDAKGKLEESFVLSTKGWRLFPRHPNNPHKENYQ